MQENQRLIKRAQRGDSDAFEELVSPYESRIYAICLRIMGNREDALDCAQDAMLRIFRALGEYRFQAAFTTWLFRITTNVCLDALRRQRVRPSTSLDALMDEGYSPPDPQASPEEALSERERMQTIREGIAMLPADMRAALVLRDIQGLSYEEVAQILHLNLGTVKSRISRARERLRKLVLDSQEQNVKPYVQSSERRNAHDL